MSWVLTHGGMAMDLLDPQPSMVLVGDIAMHLSRIARFSGATEKFYSVADHSVFVSRIVEDLGGDLYAQRAALFHDAHEAYMGDIPTPVKMALGGQAGGAIERMKYLLDVAIFEALDILMDDETALLIKHADAAALATERQRFMPDCGPDWHLKAAPSDLPLAISRSCETASYEFHKQDWRLKALLKGTPELLVKVGETA